MDDVASFFNTVAPPPLLPAAPSGERIIAATPLLYGRAAGDVSQLADLRIRQWIMQQEEDARRQEQQRLFSFPPKSP